MTNTYLIENPQEQARRVRNARLTLELCAKVKPGETVTILGGWRERTGAAPTGWNAMPLPRRPGSWGPSP